MKMSSTTSTRNSMDLESDPVSSEPYWPRQGTKRGLVMAIITGVFLTILLVIAIIYSASAQPSQSSDASLLNQLNLGLSYTPNGVTLNDVLGGKFSTRSFNGTWISDDEVQYVSENGDLVMYSVSSKRKQVLITGLELSVNLNGKLPGKCSLSADRKYVLISYDSQKIYRHSSYSKFEIYDIAARHFSPLMPDQLNVDHRLLQLAQWSPVGNAIAFVYTNNVYYRPSALSINSVQLTSSGSALVYNGVTDWVYEEEMFGTESALWFSPGGMSLAFVTFNDTPVELIQYPIYGEPGMPEYQYPLLEAIPYPKSGRANPTAKVSVVSLPKDLGSVNFKLTKDLKFPGVPLEHYIGTARWATDLELLVVTLNRHQNDSRHHLCTLEGTCQTILVDQDNGGWIDLEVPKVSSAGNQFLTLTSQQQGGSSYRHILHYTRDSLNKPITSGKFSVDSILGWDERNKRIYFNAPAYDTKTKKAIPSQSHLYYIDDSGRNPSEVTCLTCNTRNSFNDPCFSNTFELSKAFTYAVRSCSGPHVPEVTIQNLKTGQVERTWVDNADVRERIGSVKLPVVRDYDIPLGNGLVIKARLEIPANFDEKLKYPMFVDVYGGPGSQKITDSYSIDWGTSLVTSRGVIYASIDGRGSGRQSDDLKFQLHRRLGTVEIEDQIYGAEWLLNNVPFLDRNRTAIWGWSYGGYSTAMVMGTDFKGIYKCGISVAPVTSWLFYDTIYTERYMGLPSLTDNYGAYNRSDVTHYIENFRTKKYFLVHGNADDNVHYQQSMVLSRALEKADILFRQQSYPDENHGLGGVRRHLYHSLENFLFTECF